MPNVEQGANDLDVQLALVADRETVHRLEEERYIALVANDVDAFVALCHPDLRYTHSTGAVDTLESYESQLRDGHYVYQSIDHPIDRIALYGDTAIVYGEMHARISAGGVEKVLRNGCLSVWLRDGATWRFVAFQPTPLPRA